MLKQTIKIFFRNIKKQRSSFFINIIGLSMGLACVLLIALWLSGFAYKIPLSVWYFIGAGTVALLVAMLTVGTQAFAAANKNPVNALIEE